MTPTYGGYDSVFNGGLWWSFSSWKGPGSNYIIKR